MTTQVQFETNAQRWLAVSNRTASADGLFFYAVKMTHVYCRPTCRSRMPRRENVLFFDSREAAERAGFRPCLRCKPNESNSKKKHDDAVVRACRHIDENEIAPTLNELGELTGLSPFHLQRVFKRTMGLSPKQYAIARRDERFRDRLRRSPSVTHAIYDAGFNSNSRAYENVTDKLGMKPSAYRRGGEGVTIHSTILNTKLGHILVASTDKGICSVELDSNPRTLLSRLRARFPSAEIVEQSAQAGLFARTVESFIDSPQADLVLPLDIQGTAFQHRVWNALRKIPAGQTTTYQDIARDIAAPRSARAVAQACAQNQVALLIPCHRVLRSDGKISGYRWGIKRKKAILQMESTKAAALSAPASKAT